MAIWSTVAFASTVASTLGGLFGASESKKAAKRAYKQQKVLSTAEYKFNKKELEKTFNRNLEINFSNTASDLFNITQEHLTQFSSINMMTSKFSGTGLSTSSAVQDVKNVLTDEYLSKLEEARFSRDYNEELLSSQFTSNLYQLKLNKAKAQLGMSTAYTAANQAANQKMFNSVIGGATSIFKQAEEAGGFKNIFK